MTVARTGLGTINHSLLSIEALRARGVPIAGVAFIGEAHAENERIVPLLGKIPSLGRLPRLEPLTRETLRQAFAAHIDLSCSPEPLAQPSIFFDKRHGLGC
jgi:dethiobiotin synthetase